MFNRREFLIVSSLGIVSACPLPHGSHTQPTKGGKSMYTAKDYSKLLGMEGFSETSSKTTSPSTRAT